MTIDSKTRFEDLVQLLLRLCALVLIIWWCIKILSAFLVILIWGAIIAIALYPLFLRITKLLRGKTIVSSVLITLVVLSFIVIPSWLIINSLLEGIHYLKTTYESGHPIIPPPGEITSTWPEFSKPFVELWSDASHNLAKVMNQHSSQLKVAAIWFFSAFSNFGQGIVQFVASIIIAGVFLVYSNAIQHSSHKIFTKLAGENGSEFGMVTVNTIRNVVKGILGVAIIQSAMAGIGFFLAGIPFAGLWTILSLMLAIVQIGAAPVVIPIIIFALNTLSPFSAILLTVWLVLTLLSDNVLKPILLGRNAPAPMLVIFLGSIGGFITFGFIGLFLGAVILTLGYKLFETWIDLSEEDAAQTEDSTGDLAHPNNSTLPTE
jgi:predicted PurR-regulated permease PerM